ncbi:MAG: DUF4142 domain-containing protein [Lysobacter sp.]|nr:DUF4142 domain-containing protein [Lysobacter sp.]
MTITQRTTFRIAPLATALLLATTLAACAKHENENTAATAPAATSTAPYASAATQPGGATATTSDNTAMANTSGTSAGTTMGNTAAGTTTGSMSSSGGATPATTSADASAMANEMSSGPITDTDFYREAINGGQKEIDASRLAEKSSNAEVKALAKAVIADHSALDDKVKAAAGAHASAPTSPDLSSLTGKTGKDLDKAYVDMLVSDHQKDISMFENASRNASTDKAKQLATAALPKLHKHLDMAQKVQSSLQ